MSDAEPPQPVDEPEAETTPPKPDVDTQEDHAEQQQTEAEEGETAQSAQDRAADPETARDFGQFGSQMDAALRALFGVSAGSFLSAGGTANFFLGDTEVGQVGDRGTAHGPGPADMRVRSGAVAADLLERIERSYVHPDRYAELKLALENKQLLFVQARGGTGRTMTALHLLHHVCRRGVHKLDPDVALKSLQDGVFEPAHGYLLESLDPAHATELKAFHADRLGQFMRDKGCMMIVIVDESTRLPMSEIGDL